VFIVWFLISVALCNSGSIIVIENLFAGFHAMYKLVVFVVFTVLCILCMVVSERLCFPGIMKCVTHTHNTKIR
jgi:uncharacterized membrane protein